MKGQGWGQTLGLTPVGWFGFIEGLYDVVPNVEMRGWGKSGYLSEHITTLCQMSK